MAHGRPLVMLEGEVWREIAVEPWSLVAIGAGGSAWVQRIRVRPDGIGESVVQKVWPESGPEIPWMWVDMAPEFGSFAAEHDLAPFGADSDVNPVRTSEQPVELWELQGFLETGTCFGHLDAQTRQFWLIEGYPMDLTPGVRDTLAAELRARYPLP